MAPKFGDEDEVVFLAYQPCIEDVAQAVGGEVVDAGLSAIVARMLWALRVVSRVMRPATSRRTSATVTGG